MKKDKRSISAKIKERKQRKATLTIYGLIVLISFIVYGNTLGHEYALDDVYVITQNNFTKQGLAGIPDIFSSDQFAGKYGSGKNIVVGGRYRPLSLLSFAIEYQAFGESPGISHFFNILFYALTGILLFVLLLKLFPFNENQNPYLSIPFIATLLFLVHPIHTEVVANIKGRDEIFALIGSLYTLMLSLKYLESKQRKYLIYSGIVFFLGLLSKENTITFLAIVPLTAWFFTQHKFKEILFSLIPLVIASILFLTFRQLVLGGAATEIDKELLNNPFLYATLGERFATIFYTLGIYLKLLVFPHPLTFDYYPYHIPLMHWANWQVLLALFLNLALVVVAIYGTFKKWKIAWALWLYFIPLSIVSNLLFPVGVFMNERFIYFSSIGFCFVVAWWLVEMLQKKISNPSTFKTVVFIGVGLVVLLFSIKTIARNTAWKNNETLFSTDIKTSSNSIKSTAGYAEILYHKGEEVKDVAQRKELLKESISLFQKAISIHPDYVNAMLLLANGWFEYDRSVDSTLYYYLRIVKLKPRMFDVYRNLPVVIGSLKDPDKELEYWQKFLAVTPDRSDLNHQIGLLYGQKKNDLENAIKYLKRASELEPGNTDILSDLGMAYGLAKRYQDALNVFLTAFKFKPRDKRLCQNVALSYQNLGNIEKFNEYSAKASKL